MLDKRGSRSGPRKLSLGLSGLAITALASSAAVAGGVSLLYAGVQMPDSLIPSWLVRPLAILSVGAVSSSGGLPVVVSDVNTTQTAVSPSGNGNSAAVSPMRLGININFGPNWNTTRLFMNLLAGSEWKISGNGPFREVPENDLDADHNIITLEDGTTGYKALNIPPKLYRGQSVDVVCRWKGTGTLKILNRPNTNNIRNGSRDIRFTYTPSSDPTNAMLALSTVDASDPIREIDCRETDADRKLVTYAPFIDSIKAYDTLRYVQCMDTSSNKAVTWATRSRPVSGQWLGPNGYPIEFLIQIANEAKSNPWFNMPWNTDDDYIRRFAEMVRDQLDPNLKVYVENSNEVWNAVFPVTRQAIDEGLAEGLGSPSNTNLAMLQRYAERTAHVMTIWSDVFKGQESRLVRVAAIQTGAAYSASRILEFRDTATKIDAVAVAPYLNVDLDSTVKDNPASITNLFEKVLPDLIDKRVSTNLSVKAVVDSYGKRMITYESGQHLTGKDIDLQIKIQRDPRMGQIYTRYLSAWQQNVGDLMLHFRDVARIDTSGAFGLFEYAGQPINDSPKAKAFYLYMRSLGQ